MIPNICVELRIMGDDFNVESLSDQLKISPTETWCRGDEIKNTKKNRKYSCWLYSTGYQNAYDVNDLLKRIYDIFSQKKDILNDFSGKNNLDISLDIIVEMNENQTPALYFEQYLIDFVHYINARIDIDMYIL